MKTALRNLTIAALIALPSPVLAQETTTTSPESVSIAPQAHDPDAAFRAFQQFADRQRTKRIFGGAGGVIFGATTMGVGALVANKTDTSKTPWLVGGGILSGLSLLAMIVPSEAEQLASKARSSASGHSEEEAAQLLTAWKAMADSARTGRIVGNAVGLLLGAGSLGTGIALATGAGDLSDNQQAAWGGVLIGSGAALISGSVLGLFMKSDAEFTYQQFKATGSDDASPLISSFSVNVAAAPSGFFLGGMGSF